MAETDQDKTEQATPKKHEEAKKKGQVARSRELPSAAILGAALIYFYFNAAAMLQKIMAMLSKSLGHAASVSLNQTNVPGLFADITYQMILILMPLMLTVMLAAILSNVMQTGFMLSSEAIQPKFSKINPMKGFKNLFGMKSVVEMVKNIFKITLVGTVAYASVSGDIEGMFSLINQNNWQILGYIGRMSFKIVANVCCILVILAILDFLYQKWEHEKSLKMSKEEVKEENKMTEGDPQVKGRIRRMQREAARKRMMASVPKADVIITNPTHLAVALRYDTDKMHAPVVVAKGAGYIAQQIKKVALENKVPIVEKKWVAQVLYKMVPIDDAIPDHLYKAVAEILAYVYGIRKAYE